MHRVSTCKELQPFLLTFRTEEVRKESVLRFLDMLGVPWLMDLMDAYGTQACGLPAWRLDLQHLYRSIIYI